MKEYESSSENSNDKNRKIENSREMENSNNNLVKDILLKNINFQLAEISEFITELQNTKTNIKV